MSTQIERSKLRSGRAGNLGSTLLVLIIAAAGPAAGAQNAGPQNDATEEGVRTSVSSHQLRGGRESASLRMKTAQDYPALITAGQRTREATRAGFSKPGAGSTSYLGTSFDFWFYTADVQLFSDVDNDGYFYGIDLLFDVDTIYDFADVYAVVYLSFEGGPWNEYAVTEDFEINASSGSDEYVLVTELMAGYPTGSYDLLIELFDVYDGAFLASFGPDDSSALGFLPLEDINRDAPVEEVRIVVSQGGGGGAIDAWLMAFLILILLGTAGRKIWRHRHDQLLRIDTPSAAWKTGEASRGNNNVPL